MQWRDVRNLLTPELGEINIDAFRKHLMKRAKADRVSRGDELR